MTADQPGGCLWCGKEFEPRRGGSPRVFCAPSCRVAYHSACRRWVEKAIATGTLTVAALRNGDAAACTLLVCRETASAEQETGEAVDVLLNDVLAALPDDAWAALPDDVLDRIGAWLE